MLALMGYFAASRFVFYPLVLSGGVIGVCVLMFHRVRDAVDRAARPAGSDAGADDAPSRIRLIPIAVAFLLICAAVPALALIWGADMADLASFWRAVSDGFYVGDMVIAPLDFFSFLLVFSVGFVLTRIVQSILSRSVLPVTGLDAGGKAAIRAGVGYVGIILAALVAISATGLDLSNLAIVAGALSVGIGFGLQNIVNNFVSGLILLIERPIKAGDWVELASGSGYVKQVNVRSTEIQTFDRASLIVPNSELISGPVTNWTHTNLNGRLKVPVGVAYGTDPRKVETILTEIANAQPMLLRRPAPYVLFLRFGADSLDFEIRAVLRDVNWILNVTSDINFEISRRFTEEGIEIPFAQRDLHLRNAGELGQSIGEAIRGGREAAAKTGKPRPKSAPGRRSGRSDAAGNEPDSE
jgi:small-conductance mechanosensitive channel